MEDQLFDEAMVVKVQYGYDFVPVDRSVYARTLLAKKEGFCSCRKAHLQCLFACPSPAV